MGKNCTLLLTLLTKKLCSGSILMWPKIVPPNKEVILEAQTSVPRCRENHRMMVGVGDRQES